MDNRFISVLIRMREVYSRFPSNAKIHDVQSSFSWKELMMEYSGECPLCCTSSIVVGNLEHKCNVCPWSLYERAYLSWKHPCLVCRYEYMTCSERIEIIDKWLLKAKGE